MNAELTNGYLNSPHGSFDSMTGFVNSVVVGIEHSSISYSTRGRLSDRIWKKRALVKVVLISSRRAESR